MSWKIGSCYLSASPRSLTTIVRFLIVDRILCGGIVDPSAWIGLERNSR